MSKKILLVAAMFLVALSFTAYSQEFDVQMDLHRIIEKKWQMNEKIAENESYMSIYVELNKEVSNYIDNMIQLYRDKDYDKIKEFANEFKKLDVDSKNFVYSEILSILKEYENIRGEQYLPGYGYTDSDYMYKLGKETDSKVTQTYWKKEKKRIESGKKYRFYVKMEVSGEIGASIGGSSNMAAFKITGEAHFKVNGKLEKFSEVEMTTNTTVETETLLMYQKKQVWFEVLRAKKGNNNPTWEMDGTCYLYKEFPADTEIILEPGQIF